MPQTPQHDHSDDADFIRLFKAFGPPPTGRATPHLRASVLAQIEQRRAYRGLWAWLPPLRSTMWVPVLAMGLVLSLAINVWWGIAPRGTDQPLPVAQHRPAPAYRVLGEIQSPKAVDALVASHPAVEAPFAGLGFAQQDPRVTIFRMGLLYTDALAALHSGTLESATRRVQGLGKAMESLQAPRVLSHYLSAMHQLLLSQQYPGQELAKFLALFELLYEEELGAANAEVQLFRFAAWSENMLLAATAGDQAALRHAAVVSYFRPALLQLDAPTTVVEALDQIQRLRTATTLTEADMRTLRSLLQSMQKTLGALPE